MEKKGFKIVDNELTKSFFNSLLAWTRTIDSISLEECITCFSNVAFNFAKVILKGSGKVDEEMKDKVMDIMHAYLQMSVDSALEILQEELREKKARLNKSINP